MSQAPKQPTRTVSVFATAMESASVTAEITVEDIMHIEPRLSHEQAREFLSANADAIATEMLTGAVGLIVALLKGGDDVN